MIVLDIDLLACYRCNFNPGDIKTKNKNLVLLQVREKVESLGKPGRTEAVGSTAHGYLVPWSQRKHVQGGEDSETKPVR